MAFIRAPHRHDSLPFCCRLVDGTQQTKQKEIPLVTLVLSRPDLNGTGVVSATSTHA